MGLDQRIQAFITLGKFLSQFSSEEYVLDSNIPFNNQFFEEMKETIQLAKSHNGWFTENNIQFAFQSWSEALTEENLKAWTAQYKFNNKPAKTVAIIMAGNIPLVGFHDFISVLITGNNVLTKLSSNDKILLPILAQYLISVEPNFKNKIEFTTEKLENFDAVIATGSNNTARYFDYYFGKYPNIIRKNRNSVAIITGNETPDQLKALSNDIFRYYGLGCRNVSKIYFPENYNYDSFFNAMFHWKDIINETKYMNNYDYNKAVYLMSIIKLLDNEYMLLKEDEQFSSPISVVFYETYSNTKLLKEKLTANEDNIQCIVSEIGIENEIDFGKTQNPQLWDYADSIDTCLLYTS
ncbi:MAG: acyl-CoA reductase, partial [Flavobacteriaceae bacterium]|nr:acyl-CoA reductase [Flavobacteriaceae bacterium]